MNAETYEIEPVEDVKHRYPYHGVWYVLPLVDFADVKKMNRKARRAWFSKHKHHLEVVRP